MDILIGEFIFRKMIFFRKLVGTTANTFQTNDLVSKVCGYNGEYVSENDLFPKIGGYNG